MVEPQELCPAAYPEIISDIQNNDFLIKICDSKKLKHQLKKITVFGESTRIKTKITLTREIFN